jgi:hypothetical protein
MQIDSAFLFEGNLTQTAITVPHSPPVPHWRQTIAGIKTLHTSAESRRQGDGIEYNLDAPSIQSLRAPCNPKEMGKMVYPFAGYKYPAYNGYGASWLCFSVASSEYANYAE